MNRKKRGHNPSPPSNASSRSHSETAAEILRQYGIRPSQIRLAMLEHMLAHPDHATSDQLFEELSEKWPSFSKTTVSNTLQLFVDTGAIQALSTGIEPDHYDSTTEPHAHFYCTKCHRMYDVPIASDTWKALEKIAPDESRDIQILYKGICKECTPEL